MYPQKTADLTTINLLFKSVLSKFRSQFMTACMKKFYLNTPLDILEYMRIVVNMIP